MATKPKLPQRVTRGAASGTAKGSVRRTQLLDIATGLFATRGYSQTTVRDIADEAGILSGSLYHHFDSKEAMLSEVLHEFMDGLLDQFRTIGATDATPLEKFDAMVRAAFAVIHERPNAVAVYQNEATLLAHLPDFAFVGSRSREVSQTWLTVLRAGQSSGDFRSDLDMDLVYRFVRDTVWSTVRWYNPRGRLQHGTVADQFLSMVHGGLLSD